MRRERSVATVSVVNAHRVIFWQAVAVAGAIALAVTLSRFFPVISFVGALQERVISWGAWAGICYPLLFATCNILLLPGGILAVGGGFFFGLWWGFLIVFAGNVISTAISFALSRFVARHWFREKLSTNATLSALGPAVERESWKIILLSQLHPLFPTSLLNYFYGLTQIRFSTYMFWASIGRIPGLFFYAYVGTLGQLAVRIMRGKSYPRTLEYWIWGGAFMTTVLLLLVLSRVARRAIQTSSDGLAKERAERPVSAADIHKISF
ncbi:MAG: TVP38/TMEM64 family protein [Nitrospirota bacterium]